jgi:hypothetical protein
MPLRTSPQASDQTRQAEESFDGLLTDVIEFIKKVGPYCSDFEELIALAESGKNNPAQARLLIDILKEK